MAADEVGSRPDRPWSSVFLGFAKIGATSCGGGSATTVAMREMALKKHWLTEDEFLDTMVLSRLTPGISILAQAVLIGRIVAGIRGLVAAVVGLMLPAVVITVFLAGVYSKVSTLPAAAVPLRAVAGMAAGFAVALAIQLLRDTLKRTHATRGPLLFAAYVGLAFLIDNPLIILIVAIVAGTAFPSVFRGRGDDREKNAAAKKDTE
jgi:chromate transporter